MRFAIIIAVLTAVLAVTVLGAGSKTYNDMKQACDMCKNINMGGGSQNYVCPKSAVKECNININGWCCAKKRESPKCKPCWNLDEDEEDDDEI